ncbi:hypothetical protein F2Q69_00058006 [Brassica cretica]|uniref:ABC transporter domain-containing protein n=1 Tax=Brassica cretica TaxID=69181 RepID=A0A8S9MVD5_BRACR|nr:hypothetical protein F2Q69_00058006 [Brassica cretica]
MSKEQQLEGEYRQLHSRLRTHSESIAFYGGETREESHIQQKFKNLVSHMSDVLHDHWWFGMIQDFLLKYLGATVAVILIIEPFFSGHLRPDDSTLGRAEMLSNIRYHTSVIISLFQALGTLSISSRRLSRLSGYADRIHELMAVSRELSGDDRTSLQRNRSRNYLTEANYVEFSGVKVVTPTGNVLVEDLTLRVEQGSNLLITGPNGSGKSSLFRVLGGLWPLVSGHIVKPGVGSDLNKEIFYVPQRPYMAVGTLRDQLIYPLTSDQETVPLTETGMVELLENVDLEYLLDRYQPDKEVNWALVAFHDVVLSLDGEGGWSVHYKRALLDHSLMLLKKKWLYGILDDFVTKQLPNNVTWGLSLLYALEHKGDRALVSTQGELAHALRYLASVVSQSFMAFGDILELHKKFLELSGGINRIFELDEFLDASQSGVNSENRTSRLDSQDRIFFSEVDIITPAQKLMASQLSCEIVAGKSLLVTGPNGSGKTSVFRVLRDIWPTVCGRLAKPSLDIKELGSGNGIFFVPQRPYTCLGTLRDQIIYPLSKDEAEKRAAKLYGESSTEAGSVLDVHLKTILENVRLVYLLERDESGWDATTNWEDILSLGEQQRLGMARLFFHRPKFGILDECTNATSVDVEEQLYRVAKDMGVTFITSSQRPALIPFHSLELRLIDGEGNWEQRESSTEAGSVLDVHLKTILENVRLVYLLERDESGWDATTNWEDILSLGEQQRLGMARLFFHRPKFGILDECTNATSVDVEEQLYRVAKDMGVTFITSSQRPALIPFHSLELRLIDGEGNWEQRSIEQATE